MVVGNASARIAVLIDAENAPLWAVEPLLTEIARHGKAQVKRAYGDWTGSLKTWKKTLLEHSIRPVQVFAAVKGKNASDMALVIDAMDLVHSGAFDGFCLVSSDSDFTRLAERIREAGLAVYGFGERKKTNPGLIAAYDSFVFVETFVAGPALSTPAAPAAAARAGQPPTDAAAPDAAADAPQTTPAAPPPAKTKKQAKTATVATSARATTAELRSDTALISRLREAVATNTGPDGWTHLSAIGEAIRRRPTIVLKTYRYSRLKDLMVATDLFELQQRGPGKSGAVYVRVR
ncbi:NYN domain-containing protein [Frankia sp. ACN1ag]|uniref:NYN domain-containing protein n=1 Tax=Frankia sp. ACN1ag TaxID=102891 RepID=UPI0006DCAF7E|nr:NYN domain-containing protein [Frankia sp. ACN1ag]KQC38107.1 hypothetical protein UK82_12380 [Frankia sp. ACN1ag]